MHIDETFKYLNISFFYLNQFDRLGFLNKICAINFSPQTTIKHHEATTRHETHLF